MRAHDLAVGLDELELVYPTPGVTLAELLGAYYSCRRNKRNTMNALSFEVDYESELMALRDEINSGCYVPGRSVAFVVDKPVQREIVLMNKPSENCVIRGKPSDWDDLPKDKSLFHSPPDCGLPIGNLSSQVFANFYLNIFDHFVKHDLGMKYYGRYVDDFVLVHESQEYLASLIPVIRTFLADELALELHPKKIYLQHYSHGVRYLGAVIKPNRVYVGKRTKGNFYDSIMRHNAVVAGHVPSSAERAAFRASMNSYLGVMGHFDSRRLRRSMVGQHVRGWWKYAHTNGDVSKFVLLPNIG